MVRPFKLNILGQTYKIAREDLAPKGAQGICMPQQSLILLDKTLTGTELQQTFLHECFHAVMCRTGARESLSPELEEVIVDSLATFLTDHFDFDL